MSGGMALVSQPACPANGRWLDPLQPAVAKTGPVSREGGAEVPAPFPRNTSEGGGDHSSRTHCPPSQIPLSKGVPSSPAVLDGVILHHPPSQWSLPPSLTCGAATQGCATPGPYYSHQQMVDFFCVYLNRTFTNFNYIII